MNDSNIIVSKAVNEIEESSKSGRDFGGNEDRHVSDMSNLKRVIRKAKNLVYVKRLKQESQKFKQKISL